MTSHLTVSIELIAFMRWLLRNRKALLSTLVDQALNDSLYAEMAELTETMPNLSSEELHKIVNSFLSHIEQQIAVRMTNDAPQQKVRPAHFLRTLSPKTQALLHSLNEEVLAQSVQQTVSFLSHNREKQSEQSKKHLLLRNLLNNWSPDTGDEMN